MKKPAWCFLFFLFSTHCFSQEDTFELIERQLDKATHFTNKNPDSVAFYVEESLYQIDEQLKISTSPDEKKRLIQLKIRAYLLRGIRLKKEQKFYDSYCVYQKAVELAKPIKDSYLLLMAYNNIAVVYHEIGDKELRDEYFEKSLQAARGLDDYEVEKKISYNMALFYIDDKKIEEGLKVYEPIYEKAKAENDSAYIAAYWSLKGNVLLQEGDTMAAITSLEKSIAFSLNNTGSYFDITAKIDLARLLLQTGKIEKSRELINAVMDILKDSPIDRLYLEALKTLADLEKRKGNENKASLLYTRYYQINDSLEVEQNKQQTVKEGFLEKFHTEKRKDSLQLIEQKQLLESAENREQNKSFRWLFLTITLIILFTLLLYFLIKQYRKKRSDLSKLTKEKELLAKERLELKEKLLRISEMNKAQKSKKKTGKNKYALSSLKEGKREELLELLLSYMKNNKPYLNPDYSIKELAQDTGISPHHISEVLNVSFQKNFYAFVNLYRVEEAKELMRKNVDGKEKILSICYDAGFNSRATFNRVFKSITGQTPSDFQNECLQ